MICQGHGPTVAVVVTEGCGDHVALLMVFSLKQVRIIGFPQADPGMTSWSRRLRGLSGSRTPAGGRR